MNKPLMNPSQIAMLNTYADGDFAHIATIQSPEELDEALEHCGDGLLRFLMVELSCSEDCVSSVDALARVHSAMNQLAELADVLERPDIVTTWELAPDQVAESAQQKCLTSGDNDTSLSP